MFAISSAIRFAPQNSYNRAASLIENNQSDLQDDPYDVDVPQTDLSLLAMLKADKNLLKAVVTGLIGKKEEETIVVIEGPSLQTREVRNVIRSVKKAAAEGRKENLMQLSGIAAVVTKNAEVLAQLCSQPDFVTSQYTYPPYQGTLLHIALEHSTAQITELLIDSVLKKAHGERELQQCIKRKDNDGRFIIQVAVASNDIEKFNIIWDRHKKLEYGVSGTKLLEAFVCKDYREAVCNEEIFSCLWEEYGISKANSLAPKLIAHMVNNERNYTSNMLSKVIPYVGNIGLCSELLQKVVRAAETGGSLPDSAFYLIRRMAQITHTKNERKNTHAMQFFLERWNSYPDAGKERLLIEGVARSPKDYASEVREIIVSGVSNPKAYQEALDALIGTHASPIHSQPEFVEVDDAASESVTPQSSRTGSSASFPEVDASTRDDTTEEVHVADLLVRAAAKADAAVILEEMLTSYKQALPDNNYTGILNKLMGEVSEYNQPVLAVIANAYVANLLYHSAKLDENIVPCLDANDEAVVKLLKKVTLSSEEQKHFQPLWSLVKDNNKAALAAQLLMHIATAQTSNIYNGEICETLLAQVLDNQDVCRKIAHSFLGGKIAGEAKETLVTKMLLQHPSILLQREDDKTTLQLMKDNKAYEEDYNYYTSQLNWNAISKTCYGAAFGVVCSSIIGSCYLLGVFNIALMPLVGIMLAITLTTAAIGYIDAEFVSKPSFVESIVKSQNSIASGVPIV